MCVFCFVTAKPAAAFNSTHSDLSFGLVKHAQNKPDIVPDSVK